MALVKSISGIRGIYGKDLTESIAVMYAHSYNYFLQKASNKKTPLIVIGMDTRPSSGRISDAILSILDCSFIDVGIAPTPAVEFAVRHFRADGGIIITASHNEPYYNGFKFLGPSGAVLDKKSMDSVIRWQGSLKNFHKISERKVFEKNTEAIKGYSNFILGIIGRSNVEKIRNSGQKVVIDPNGGAGAIAKKILEEIGVKVTAVNMPYGEFNRKIEPSEDSMIYLKGVIDESESDFAAGFDCDADRVEILTGDGRLVSGHYILALAAEHALSMSENSKNESVVANNATSNVVRNTVKKYGAKLIEVEAGEINVVRQMQKCKAILGGEGSSGGVIIPPSKCRDGILTLLTVLSIIASKEKKLEHLLEDLPNYYTLSKKVQLDSKKHTSMRKLLTSHYSKKGLEVNVSRDAGGSLKVTTGINSFVWFRSSRTEDGVFRVISDSDSKEEAERLMNEALELLKG